MLVVHDLVGAHALRREALLQPEQRRRDLRILVAQPLHELNGEGSVQGRCRFALAKHRGERLGGAPVHPQEPVGQGVGFRARGPAHPDAHRRAPQVLDEGHAQRDRDCPQLADRQRLNALVGAHEAAQHLLIEAAVGMRDEGPGHAENPRIPGERPAGELRQLAVVARRQIVADLAYLLLDQVVVVEQPLGGRRNGAPFAHRARDAAIGLKQYRLVFPEAYRERAPGDRSRGDALGRGQAFGMLLEALDAEELLADRLFAIPRYGLRPAPEGAPNEFQPDLSWGECCGGKAIMAPAAPASPNPRYPDAR
jgi:hypothetical protein